MTTNERWIREKTINDEMCSKCKGACCKKCGCSFLPQDLDMSFENLFKKLKNREISIDQFFFNDSPYKRLDPPIFYLRVANVGETSIAIGKLGRCSLLKENGCSLSYDNRPSGGKYLVPFWSGCYYLYSTDEFVSAWTPYQELLKKLVNSIERGC